MLIAQQTAAAAAATTGATEMADAQKEMELKTGASGDLSYPNKCRTWCEIFNTKMLKRSLA